MSASSSSASPERARSCPRCGALNGSDFERCIRCGVPLSAAAFRDRDPASTSDERDDVFWATRILVGITTVIFAAQIAAALSRTKSIAVALITGGHMIDLMRFGAMPVDLDVVQREPWLLLSCVFVHFGALHFLLNMMGLVNFARVAEPAMGSARFTIVYVLSGLAGSVATVAVSALAESQWLADLGLPFLLRPRGMSAVATTAGASGAIFGIMGLLLGWLLRRRDPRWKGFAVQAVLFGVLFGFAVNASPQSPIAINNAAHLGGLACGIVFGLIYGGGRRWTPDWLVRTIAAICVLACIASLGLAQLSPRWRVLDQRFRSSTSQPASPPEPRSPPSPSASEPRSS